MDPTSFNAVKRFLTGVPSRRHVLRGMASAGFGLGILSLSDAEAAKKGSKGKGKTKGKKKNKRDVQVRVCHQGETIAVAKSALAAHLAHGASEGACSTAHPSSNPSSGPTCSDGITNGSETDVDCGGTCLRCATGKTCASRNDCASARCEAGTCQTCADPNTDCGVDVNGGMCACRDHESGQRFCTKINGRLLPAGTPCTVCVDGEQCFPINGGAGGIECILPCGAPNV